jgi:drug/metabolite transporter (DMT)-like permease
MQIVGYVVPAVAGLIAAKRSTTRPVINGTLGGSLGVVLVLVPAAFIPGYPLAGIPFVLVIYVLLAAFGAILGNHFRGRVGP